MAEAVEIGRELIGFLDENSIAKEQEQRLHFAQRSKGREIEFSTIALRGFRSALCQVQWDAQKRTIELVFGYSRQFQPLAVFVELDRELV